MHKSWNDPESLTNHPTDPMAWLIHLIHTYCWWFRNPKQGPLGCSPKPVVNNGRFSTTFTATGEFTGFLVAICPVWHCTHFWQLKNLVKTLRGAPPQGSPHPHTNTVPKVHRFISASVDGDQKSYLIRTVDIRKLLFSAWYTSWFWVGTCFLNKKEYEELIYIVSDQLVRIFLKQNLHTNHQDGVDQDSECWSYYP